MYIIYTNVDIIHMYVHMYYKYMFLYIYNTIEISQRITQLSTISREEETHRCLQIPSLGPHSQPLEK